MRRTPFALAVGVAVAALALTGCGGGDEEATPTDTETTTTTTTEPTTPAGTTLKGSVGPGYEISLSTPEGQSISTLAPGSYTLQVDDMASSHNFHLTGPGVDVTTDVGGEGTDTFQIEVQRGSYSFVCDVHPSINGSFEVTG